MIKVVMAIIVDGNKIASEILANLKLKIDDLRRRGLFPLLVVILVGSNSSSLSYIKKKKEAGEAIGIRVEVREFSAKVTQEELESEIKKLNYVPEVCGLLVQLPLPSHLDKQKILDAVKPELDVDSLSTANRTKLAKGRIVLFIPPAAAAILKILEHYRIGLKDKKVLLVGLGELVGQPLAVILRNQKINFSQADSKTKDLKALTEQADVIITGVGKPRLISGGMVKDGAVVIDAGTAGTEAGELAGDVDFRNVAYKARLITPVPGGVGPVTVAMLMENVVKAVVAKSAGRI